ncbi:PREDICTED: uncharacterized protein LOC106809149 isoform X1 [Priapulus caudatus]|uniref:Uncharacterized protein LOC106809149 isoform X1 n=1 Tax=Priapulus caudatus TaxID=37621 RepID=A0ABM1E5Z4_PRICU|nr:PREDICTED: uncharacterized protein LOC106809149 isoform X1 [Priapulus caudatus]XP_014667616.1 PREDICTED: uncharacterized protein LOC106809149 isoform X1 [Priapulus caudatus]
MFEEWHGRMAGVAAALLPFSIPDHTYTLLQDAHAERNWSIPVGLEDMGDIGNELCLGAERTHCRGRCDQPMEIAVEEGEKGGDGGHAAYDEASDHNYSWSAVSDIEMNFTQGAVASPDARSDHSYACGDSIWNSMVVGEDHCYSRSLQAILALPPHRAVAERRHGGAPYLWPDIRLTEHNYSSNQELNRAGMGVAPIVRSRSDHLHVDHNYTHVKTAAVAARAERRCERKPQRKLQGQTAKRR